jgi:hypothetical protein
MYPFAAAALLFGGVFMEQDGATMEYVLRARMRPKIEFTLFTPGKVP